MITNTQERVVGSPPYSDFPRSEYEDRVERARQGMEKSKIDLLVLWDSANIRYFSGFHSLHWPCMSFQPAVYLLPLDQDPVIVVPDFFAGVAEGYTYLDDIRYVVDPHVTQNIREFPADVANAVKVLGCSRQRIGLESGWLGGMTIPRPLNDIDYFRKTLDDATFVDACGVIWSCRMIKSPSEVEAVRHASEAVVRAYGDVGASFELGMSERDVASMLRNAILKYTEDCTPPIATACSRIAMPDTPSFYNEVALSIGDCVVCEPLPTHKGYCGSCARVFQIGPLSDEALRKAELTDRAQEAAFRATRPGVRSGDLVQVVADVLGDEGIAYPGDGQSGHGVGLGLHEPPMVARGEEGVIREGMVLAIEVWVVDAWSDSSRASDDADVYGNEDLIVVTKDGCELLPSLPRELRCLPF